MSLDDDLRRAAEELGIPWPPPEIPRDGGDAVFVDELEALARSLEGPLRECERCGPRGGVDRYEVRRSHDRRLMFTWTLCGVCAAERLGRERDLGYPIHDPLDPDSPRVK